MQSPCQTMMCAISWCCVFGMCHLWQFVMSHLSILSISLCTAYHGFDTVSMVCGPLRPMLARLKIRCSRAKSNSHAIMPGNEGSQIPQGGIEIFVMSNNPRLHYISITSCYLPLFLSHHCCLVLYACNAARVAPLLGPTPSSHVGRYIVLPHRYPLKGTEGSTAQISEK